MKEPTRFIVIFRGRSGSNMLATTLNNHTDVICHSELLHRNRPFYNTAGTQRPDSNWTTEERNRRPSDFVEGVLENSGNVSAIGFKIAWNQNNKFFLKLLANRNIKKVIVERRNTIDSYTSYLIAKKTRSFIHINLASEPEPTPDHAMVKVSFVRFLAYSISTKSFFLVVKLLLHVTGQKWAAIEYSQIRDKAALGRIFEHLHVPNEDCLTQETVRQNPIGHRHRISNFDWFSFWVKLTPFRSYLVKDTGVPAE